MRFSLVTVELTMNVACASIPFWVPAGVLTYQMSLENERRSEEATIQVSIQLLAIPGVRFLG